MTVSVRFPVRALAVAVSLAGLVGCAPSQTITPASDQQTTAAPQPSAPATLAPSGSPAVDPVSEVAQLSVKGRGPRTGYSREAFGPAWKDVDRNGCDTRNDILRRDLVGEVFRDGTRGCVVLSGRLTEPYTGRAVLFSKSRASEVQIDHVVSLSDAWQKGAAQWPTSLRVSFANDPLNLLAVDGRANQSKGDSDTASWLPPNKSYRCAFVSRQVAVKTKYAISVTPAERDAMTRVLSRC
jgi:hypothetical protein